MADDEKQAVEESSEEQEYSFTDETPDYDMSTSAGKEVNAASTGNISAFSEKILTRALDNRRLLVGVFVVFLLVVAVYRMFTSSDSTDSADIVTAVASDSSPNIRQDQSRAISSSTTLPTQQISKQGQGIAESTKSLSSRSAAQRVLPSTPPIQSSLGTGSVRAQPQTPSVARNQFQSQALSPPLGSLSARVVGVEKQNTAILNTLQTEYAKKITSLERQNDQIQAEIRNLSSDVLEIKQAFHALANMLENSVKSSSAQHKSRRSSPTLQHAKIRKYRANKKHKEFKVQAIIPGRAWLRSNSGETITVALGDSLAGLGRVVRIDPYDGTVELESGNKVVTLAYSVGADN